MIGSTHIFVSRRRRAAPFRSCCFSVTVLGLVVGGAPGGETPRVAIHSRNRQHTSV